uniref:Uncharacterized protein n=1 Tax=Mantoniella antarctica TaxID=81844 RepID=A0A7S0X7T2_9CHLO
MHKPNCTAAVYFVVRKLQFGSAQHRGIQPAFALQQQFGIQSHVLDCSYYCGRDKWKRINERVTQSAKKSIFIHNDVPCECLHNIQKAFHILDLMDTLDITPKGFDMYIVATESIKVAVQQRITTKGLRIPVEVVPYHHSNLLGRKHEHGELSRAVDTVLYVGSKPSPGMVASVRKFLAHKHRQTRFLVIGGNTRRNQAIGLHRDAIIKSNISTMWPLSVAYSDGFAVDMSTKGNLAIMWDQCSQYVQKCSSTDSSCRQVQEQKCLSLKDDSRLLNHLACGLPTVAYGKYQSSKDLLMNTSYPLVASTTAELLLVLDNAILNATLRVSASEIGLDIARARDICSTAAIYAKVVCISSGGRH